MYSLPKNVYRERIDFSKIKTTVPIPNLIEIQKKSYERFLQMNRLPSEREDAGLQSVFKSVFPISDFRENSSLEFIEYSIGNWECKCGRLSGLHHLRKPCVNCGHTLIADPYGEHEVLCPRCGKPNEARGDICDICGNTVGLKLKYDVDECQERGMTYAVPLKVTIRLVVWNKDPETGVKTIRDIKEQEVYYGDIPLMTDNGTFIINGTERVIVSQLHRSPGRVLPFGRQDAVHRPDHPLPRLLGGVRVRRQEPALRPHRSQAEVPGHGVPARARPARRRRDHPQLLHRRSPARPGRLDPVGRGRQPARAARRQGHQGRERYGHRRRQEDQRQRAGGAQEGERRGGRSRRRRARRSLRRVGRCRSVDRRSDPRGQRAARAARRLDGAGEERREARDLLPREGRRRLGAVVDPEEGSDPHPRRGADRDLPPSAAGRSPDARQLAVVVREHVLQPAEVRLLARRPAQAEHQAEAEHAARREDPAPAGLLRGHQVPAQAAPLSGQRGRHRSSRQPARSLGRRAAREPVPDRARPHGARDQGKDVGLPGNGDRHAARPDQREAGHGRDSRVLRVVAAVAVHGPDQPAVRSDAQAPALGARPRRIVAGARRLRGARRAPDALRPDLPDRDPGRSEHRVDFVAVVLRADQRVRLYREPVPESKGRTRRRLRRRHQRRRQHQVQGR